MSERIEDRRVVLLDMDGVLIESFRAWVRVLEEARARRGLGPLGEEAIRESWGQGIAADAETWFPGAKVDELAREYARGFAEHAGAVELIEGAREALEALARAERPRALVTNSPRDMTERVLEAKGIGPLIPTRACGDEVERGKPDPAIVRLALERLGARAEDALLVGDTALDMEAARAAGVLAMGFRRDDGDARVDDLRALVERLGLG